MHHQCLTYCNKTPVTLHRHHVLLSSTQTSSMRALAPGTRNMPSVLRPTNKQEKNEEGGRRKGGVEKDGNNKDKQMLHKLHYIHIPRNKHNYY